jgi:hypothetical protein
MITGLKSVEREVEALREMLPRQPTAQDDAQAAFMARFTSREIIRISEILTRVDQGTDPTVEEVAFLQEMEARPILPLAPIDPTKPVCEHCNKQPASERALAILCDDCWGAMGGNFDINKLIESGQATVDDRGNVRF